MIDSGASQVKTAPGKHRHQKVVSAEGPSSTRSYKETATDETLKAPFHNFDPPFLRRKQSPGTAGTKRRILHLYNYKGFQDKHNLVPDVHKRNVLHSMHQISTDDKLSLLVPPRSQRHAPQQCVHSTNETKNEAN